MSVASEITRIKNNISSAYTSLESKGATLPEVQNSANLVDTIDSISTGSGEVVENAAMRLIDWEGTILKEYSKADALALEVLPAPSTLSAYAGVDHELLLFQEWNWSLADIKTWVQGHEGEALLVGAIYTTTDQTEHYYRNDSRMNGDATVCKIKTHGPGSGMYFNNYYSLISVNVPNTRTYLKSNMCGRCYFLTSINLPNSITHIYDHAFSYCWFLTSISLPNSITYIADSIFENCYSLTSINIPNTITYMGTGVFYGCKSLTYVNIPNIITSIPASTFRECSRLAFIKLPDTMIDIGDYAFYNCKSLFSITIPNNTTSLGERVFDGCSSLKGVLIEGKPSLSNKNAFQNNYSGRRFYVPRVNLSWFETATNWSTLYSSFVAIEDNIAYLESLGYNVDAYK